MEAQTETQKWVPRDNSFGARLAMVRQRFGWNLKEASLACGLPQNSWLEWESNGREPRNIVQVVETISEHTKVDDYWLLTGRDNGELPSDPMWSPLSDLNRRPPLYKTAGSHVDLTAERRRRNSRPRGRGDTRAPRNRVA